MSQIKKVAILLIVTTIFLNACVSSRVESNKRKDFTSQVKKIFITGKGSSGTKDYIKWFSKELLEGLKSKSVDCVFYYYDPLAMETEEDVLKMINDYAPDAVLNIQQTESTIAVNSWGATRQAEAIFMIKMFIPNDKNPVWKAQMGVSAEMDLSLGGKQSAKRLIEKMVADKIILK